MPSLVPNTRRNAVRSTRNALLQPPAHVYIPPVDGYVPLKSTIRAAVYLPPFDNMYTLDHTSPHKYLPASFAEAAARAASPANALEDNDEKEGVNLKGTFNDLVGEETSGLDDLSYSSAEYDEDYDDNIDLAARQIEYSDSNHIHHCRRQTNFIPGGPKQPLYDGMSAAEKVMAKQEYKSVRNKFTDGLRLKRLKEQNKNFNAEAFSGCLTLAYEQWRTFISVGSKSITHFPTKRFLSCVSPKRPTYEGSTLFAREVISVSSSVRGQDFV